MTRQQSAENAIRPVGDFHRGPIARAYAEALGTTIDNPLTPVEWVARLETLPVIDQPGAGFH